MAVIPNFLSLLRLGLVPVLLLLAWNELAQIFLFSLILSLITDAADGYLARRLNATSPLGAKLDSWADFTTTLALPFCAWWLRPDAIRAEAVAIGVAVFFYVAPIVIGFLKFRRLTSYHTWLAKTCAVVLAVVVVVFFAGGPGWPWRVLAPLVVICGLEEIAITVLFREWRANVPTLWHAREIKRARATVKPASDAR
ncbi:MAG: CDP-alcohol phosphatidyltransferase [Pedosphaera sp.]|nr:CDP-alcohol phosphatidyltransferase [Pedosphaera sp.]